VVDRAPDAAQNPNDVAGANGQVVDRTPDAAQNPKDVAGASGQVVDRTPDAAQEPDDIATASGHASDRAPDEVQAAPPSMREEAADQTVGMAPISLAADAAQTPSQFVIEHQGMPMAGRLDALWIAIVMMMVVWALGIIRSLSRRTYPKRILAFSAMRLQDPAVYPRWVELPMPPRNAVEAHRSAAPSLHRVRKPLGIVEEAVDEFSSRQLERPWGVGADRMGSAAGSGLRVGHKAEVINLRGRLGTASRRDIARLS
jgi:hypothetical protein